MLSFVSLPWHFLIYMGVIMYLKCLQNYMKLFCDHQEHSGRKETFFNITMKWRIVTNHSCDILPVLLCFRPPIFIFTYISSLSLTNLIIMVLEEDAIAFASHDLFFSLTDGHCVQQLFPLDSHVSSYICFIILASMNLSNKRMFPSTIFLLPWKLSYKLINTFLLLWYLFIRFNQ